jgi:hypothetical protein
MSGVGLPKCHAGIVVPGSVVNEVFNLPTARTVARICLLRALVLTKGRLDTVGSGSVESDQIGTAVLPTGSAGLRATILYRCRSTRV